MVDVVRYSEPSKRDWDEFVSGCRNETFLFRRDYMGYHADRFPDHSLMFYRKGRPVAVLPATARGGVLNSHAGLTFGGFLVGAEATTPTLLEALDSLLEYMGSSGLGKLIYKCIPWIYH